MKNSVLFILLIVGFFACKSSEDIAEPTPAPAPSEEPEETSTVAEEAPKPQLVMDTVRETTKADTTLKAANSNMAAAQTSAADIPTEGDGEFRVQLDATMGTVFKPKYKGFNKIYFEDGAGGSKVYVGKNLSKVQAEQLRDEYKLRGFEDAFVVSMSGTGKSAGSKFTANASDKKLSAEDGAVFLVQLIAYRGPQPPRKLRKVNFYQILGFDDGFKRIYSGTYSTVEEARAGQEMFKKSGFKDCYVVPFEGYKNKLNGLVGTPIQP